MGRAIRPVEGGSRRTRSPRYDTRVILFVHVALTIIGLCGVVGGLAGGSRAIVATSAAMVFVGGLAAFGASKALFVPPLVRVRLLAAGDEEKAIIHAANARMMGTVQLGVGLAFALGAALL